jgi:hypothetical protein
LSPTERIDNSFACKIDVIDHSLQEGYDAGTYASISAARDGLRAFILWRLVDLEDEAWVPTNLPWGEPTFIDERWDSSCAHEWIAHRPFLEVVEWYQAQFPEDQLIVQRLNVIAEVPSPLEAAATGNLGERFIFTDYDKQWAWPNSLSELLSFPDGQ